MGAFVLGGSARADVAQLVFWRPLTAIALALALVIATLPNQHVPAKAYCFIGALALIVLLQLIPLPSSIWTSLPGRSLLVEATSASGTAAQARPLSFVPARTWNAFFALIGPAAILIFALLASREGKFRAVLTTFVIMGLISALFGLLQIIGPPDGPLYLYRVTNSGSGVGLFANKNHQAVMLACLFPMLATLLADRSSGSDPRRALAIFAAAGAFLLPMILVTGSRAGLLFGLVGIAAIPLVWPLRTIMQQGKRGKARAGRWVAVAGAALFIGLVGATLFFSRAEAIYRLINPIETRDIRTQSLATSVSMAEKYFPAGSGFGTFADVYKIDEPARLLAPTYLNQAHNDWLQVIIEGGIGAALFGFLFLIFWIMRVKRAFSGPLDQRARYARLGAIISAILLLASIVDYPLRVPAMAFLFMIAIAWMEIAGAPEGGGMKIVANRDSSRYKLRRTSEAR